MTPQQIKDAKPNEATHYHKNIFGVKYYRRKSNEELFQVYVDGVWIASFITPHKPKPLVKVVFNA